LQKPIVEGNALLILLGIMRIVFTHICRRIGNHSKMNTIKYTICNEFQENCYGEGFWDFENKWQILKHFNFKINKTIKIIITLLVP